MQTFLLYFAELLNIQLPTTHKNVVDNVVDNVGDDSHKNWVDIINQHGVDNHSNKLK